MELVTLSQTLPSPKPGWVIWGRTKKNELLNLGEYARLSLGQKILGTFTQFYHVDLTPQEVPFECDARSANGELYFRVIFDVVCAVKSDRVPELLQASDPLSTFIKKELQIEAQDVSEKYSAEQDREFQAELKLLLDPRRGGSLNTGPMIIQRLSLRAHLPGEVQAREEIASVLRDLPARVALSEARGDTETAKRLRNARSALLEADKVRRDETLGAAAQARAMGRIIRDAEENAEPDSDYVKLLKAEQKDMLKRSGVHVIGADGHATPKTKNSPKSQDDPNDLN